MASRQQKTKVLNNDLWVLLLSCIRYSMGRMTYMSSLAPELVLKYKDSLTSHQLRQIAEEIGKELEIRKLGMDCDNESWKNAKIEIDLAADKAEYRERLVNEAEQ